MAYSSLFPAIILLSLVSIMSLACAQIAPLSNNILPSPLKQFKTGISVHEIKCNQGFVLINKQSDNSPACVKPQTAQKLVQRGWGIMPSSFSSAQNGSIYLPNVIKVSNANFTIYYDITGGTITTIKQEIESKSFIISIQTTSDGSLTIEIPRAFYDAKAITGQDDSFYILENGQGGTDHKEVKKTVTYRTEVIPFKHGTEEIEFIKTQMLSGG